MFFPIVKKRRSLSESKRLINNLVFCCLKPKPKNFACTKRESKLHSFAHHPLRSSPTDRISLRALTSMYAASRVCICSDDEFPKVITRRPLPRVVGHHRMPSGVRCWSENSPGAGRRGSVTFSIPATSFEDITSSQKETTALHAISLRTMDKIKFASETLPVVLTAAMRLLSCLAQLWHYVIV